MAKRTVKERPAQTLGSVFGNRFATNVQFTIASKLARITVQNELENGYALFDRHLSAGNIVEARKVGLFPGVTTYIIAKPDAPALI